MNKENEIKRRIEMLIDIANGSYQLYGWNEAHELRLARIDGMIEVLSILTEKEYYYNEEGLHEKQ